MPAAAVSYKLLWYLFLGEPRSFQWVTPGASVSFGQAEYCPHSLINLHEHHLMFARATGVFQKLPSQSLVETPLV